MHLVTEKAYWLRLPRICQVNVYVIIHALFDHIQEEIRGVDLPYNGTVHKNSLNKFLTD